MNLTEEYILSEYQELGSIHEEKNIQLIRNKISGAVCVKKVVSIELQPIYQFLKTHPQPNIPMIYHLISNDHSLIVLEEYCTGQNLEEILETTHFSEKKAGQIIIELCHALEPLHVANIICRDLKPANVMITTSGEIKLIDFNIARTYQEGQSRDTQLMGTEAFAAPEQFGFGQTDPRTDIYSLGVLLNYLILKQFPIDHIVEGPLHDIIKRCISMDPKDRYQSVKMLSDDLEKLCSPLTNEKNTYNSNSVINTANEKKSFIIPGFRSKTLWKMIVAILGYAFITYFCFTLTFDSNGIPLPEGLQIVYRVTIWIFQLLFIAIICNYRNWKQSIPLVNHKNRLVRILGYCLTEIILFITSAFVCAMIELIFFSSVCS